MIKILRYKKTEIDNKPCYKIKEENNRIFFSYKDFNSEQKYELYFSKEEILNGIYEIIIVEGTTAKKITLNKKYEFIERTGSKSGYARNGQKVGQIFAGKNEIIIALSYPCDEIKPYKNIIIEKEETMTSAFRKESKEYETITDSFFLKQDMINNTNIYNSITYLESQVDCLTRVVLTLYKENDELKRILQEANKYNILDIKSEKAMIKEFERDKKNMRSLQKKYYEEKLKEHNH